MSHGPLRSHRALVAGALVASLWAAFGVSATYVYRDLHDRAAARVRPEPPTRRVRPRVVETARLPASAAELAASLEATLTLAPDARFVRAARFLPGEPALPPLPPLADFDVAYEALVARVTAPPPAVEAAPDPTPRHHHGGHHSHGHTRHEGHHHRHAVETPALPAPSEFPRDAVGALRDAGDDLSARTRALVSLAFQTWDALDLGDDVTAQALASLAVSRARGAPVVAGEALLAWRMGYTASARRRADTLAPEDITRAFVTGDSAALATGDGFARVLACADLDRRGDRAGLRARLADAASRNAWESVLYATIAAADDAATADQAARALPQAVLSAMAREEGAPLASTPTRTTLGTLDALDAAAPRALAALLAARHRAMLGTAIDHTARIVRDTAPSSDAATAFLRGLGETASPEITAVVRWAQWRVDGASELTGVDALGGAAFLDAFDRGTDSLTVASAPMRDAVRRTVARLDARPAHRAWTAWAALSRLLDTHRATGLYRSVVETSPGVFPTVEAQSALLRGDLDAVEAMTRDEAMPMSARRAVVDMLAAHTDDDARVARAWTSLLASPTTPVEARLAGARWLTSHGEPARAREALDAWLAGRDGDATEETVTARVERAHALQGEGRLDEAWVEAGALVPTLRADAMRRAALVRAEMGEHDDAVRIAAALAGRHPGPESAAVLAEALWRAHDPSRAGRALATVPEGDPSWGTTLASRFTAVFRGRTADADAAARAMTAAGVSAHALHTLGAAVSDPALSLEVLEPLRATNVEQVDIVVDAYAALRAAHDDDTAVAWIARVLTPATRAAIEPVAFARGYDALLWVASAPTDHTWLLRASAANRARYDTRRAEIDAWYASPHSSPLDPIGQVAAGRSPPALVQSLALDRDLRTVAAFHLGLRADRDGRHDEASDWWLLAAQLGGAPSAEGAWALDRLTAQASPMHHAAPAPVAPVTLPPAVDATAPAPHRHHHHHHDA